MGVHILTPFDKRLYPRAHGRVHLAAAGRTSGSSVAHPGSRVRSRPGLRLAVWRAVCGAFPPKPGDRRPVSYLTTRTDNPLAGPGRAPLWAGDGSERTRYWLAV
jgi:hypothetical protein